MMNVDHLPPLLHLSHAAKELGVTLSRMRNLVHKRRIGFVYVGARQMIPREELPRFISNNTVPPCPDETPVPVSASLKSESAFTSAGPKLAAAGSAARARQIANKLKSSSPSSCVSEHAPADRVIPLKP